MKAGLLRHKIKIEQETVTRNEYGEEEKTWSIYASAYASVKTVSDKEYFAAKQTQSERNTSFRVRYSLKMSKINTEMRIKWGSRVFDIEGIQNENERDRSIVIVGREVDV